MTLTNTRTILRQMGVKRTCGGYHPEAEDMDYIPTQNNMQRIQDALNKYREAIHRIGRAATPAEIAEECGGSKSAVCSFIRKNPHLFIKTPVPRARGNFSFLVELRNN